MVAKFLRSELPWLGKKYKVGPLKVGCRLLNGGEMQHRTRHFNCRNDPNFIKLVVFKTPSYKEPPHKKIDIS